MATQFSPKVSEVLAFSREEAYRLASTSVGPEHLLLGMIREKKGPLQDMFIRFNVNVLSVKGALEQRVRGNSNGQINSSELVLNDKANNILRLAVLEARVQHTDMVDIQHLVLAILHDQVDNGAKEVLEINNVTYEDVLTFFYNRLQATQQNGIGLPDDEEEDETEERMNGTKGAHSTTSTKAGAHRRQSKTPVLDNFSTDLTQAATDGKLDPVVGREKEMQRVIEILCRRKKNNPILIGEPGVGKSAIVEGLAQLIASKKTSPILYNKRLVNLDMAGMVAGTKYRGQFEERIKALLKEIENSPDIIIFIDEIHTIIGAGSTPGSMDAANIMKPALARGTIQCIGATTLDEYRNSIEKDGALERRFQKVLVQPTTTEETLNILENIKDRYEEHHHVTYTPKALDACVRLTERYISDRSFPDKAIDALDEVGSHVHIMHATVPPELIAKENELIHAKQLKQDAVHAQNFELAAKYRDEQTRIERELNQLNSQWQNDDEKNREPVDEEEVANVVSMMAGVPVQRIAESENIRLRNMAGELKKTVIAQDAAIDKMVRSIQRNRVGLRDPNHPIGVFMFLGPTGVGKTYLAKKLAEYMFGTDNSLIRIDMSEYTESFNVSRLVGAPPGYVGYEEGGQLTEKVRRHPYSIVLLDEVEKAHAAVFNLLLQVLDEGRLTDGLGRLIDFRNTIIIMTSNSGTRQLKEFGRGVGFTAGSIGGKNGVNAADKEYARAIIQKALSRQFAPEFLNRLDEIITFDQLDMNAMLKIVDIEINHVSKRFKDMGYTMTMSEEAKKFLARKGYDVQFGARPLKRAVQSYVEDGICNIILKGTVNEGDVIQIDVNTDSDSLIFDRIYQKQSGALSTK